MHDAPFSSPMESKLTEEPKVRKEYLEKLGRVRKERFIRVKNFAERYGHN